MNQVLFSKASSMPSPQQHF